MEHLRFLARAELDHPEVIAREAARALARCADQPELVVASRRLLDRHPACGPLWWVTARAVTAPHHRSALDDAAALLDGDPTPTLAEAFASEGRHRLIQAWMVAPDGLLVAPSPSHPGPEDAPICVVAGLGSVVSAPVWEAALRRLEVSRGPIRVRMLAPDAVSMAVSPSGVVPPTDLCDSVEFPLAPELLTQGV